jgi:hypothetical protein
MGIFFPAFLLFNCMMSIACAASPIDTGRDGCLSRLVLLQRLADTLDLQYLSKMNNYCRQSWPQFHMPQFWRVYMRKLCRLVSSRSFYWNQLDQILTSSKYQITFYCNS